MVCLRDVFYALGQRFLLPVAHLPRRLSHSVDPSELSCCTDHSVAKSVVLCWLVSRVSELIVAFVWLICFCLFFGLPALAFGMCAWNSFPVCVRVFVRACVRVCVCVCLQCFCAVASLLQPFFVVTPQPRCRQQVAYSLLTPAALLQTHPARLRVHPKREHLS